MGETRPDLQPALDHARKTRQDLDRRIFYLKTLLETSKELSGIIKPQKMLDTFLLMTMGPLGITRGLAGLLNTQSQSGHVTGRGLGDDDLEEVRGNLGAICRRYFSGSEPGEFLPARIRMISLDSFEPYALLPPQTHTLLLWMLTGNYAGFLALGEKLTGQPLDEGDAELLHGLTEILRGAMNHALSVLNIQQLNADLLKKNEELQKAFGEIQASREELDRRVFHLKSLSDLGSELSPLLDMDRLLRTFLMMVAGSLGASQGFVMVQDRKTHRFQFAGLGLGQQPQLNEQLCER